MRLRPLQFLSETPLTGYDYVGRADHDSSYARPGTARMAQNPEQKHRAERVFKNLPWSFRVVFLDRATVASGAALERDRTDLPAPALSTFRKDPLYYKGYMGPVEGIGGVYPERGTITFVINSDDGDNYMPFTPWMIAHRFGHALIAEHAEDYPMKQLYGFIERIINTIQIFAGSDEADSVIHAVGQFESARGGKLSDIGEFVIECLAQFLVRGRVEFNSIPQRIPARSFLRAPLKQPGDPRTHMLNPSLRAELNDDFRQGAATMNELFTTLMDQAVGKLYVT